MHSEGYEDITNMDNSKTCINIINERYEDMPQNFKCNLYNIRFINGCQKHGFQG